MKILLIASSKCNESAFLPFQKVSIEYLSNHEHSFSNSEETILSVSNKHCKFSINLIDRIIMFLIQDQGNQSI